MRKIKAKKYADKCLPGNIRIFPVCLPIIQYFTYVLLTKEENGMPHISARYSRKDAINKCQFYVRNVHGL